MGNIWRERDREMEVTWETFGERERDREMEVTWETFGEREIERRK